MLNLKRLLLSVVLLACLSLAVQQCLLYSLRKSDYTKIWWVWNYVKDEQFNYAFLGNSGPLTGINSAVFNSNPSETNAINLSVSDSDFSTYYMMLRYFLEHNHNKLKYLLLHINLNELSNAAREDDDNLYNFIPYMQDTLVYEHYKHMYPDDAKKYKRFPLLGISKFNSKLGIHVALNSYVHFSKKKFNAYGDLLFPKGTTSLEKQEKKNDTVNLYKPITTEGLYYLDKIAALCEKHQIALIGFTIPVRRFEGNVYQGEQVMISAIEQVLKERHGKYLSTLHLIDAYDAENFFDLRHLNSDAATVFSKQLYDLLQSHQLQ